MSHGLGVPARAEQGKIMNRRINGARPTIRNSANRSVCSLRSLKCPISNVGRPMSKYRVSSLRHSILSIQYSTFRNLQDKNCARVQRLLTVAWASSASYAREVHEQANGGGACSPHSPFMVIPCSGSAKEGQPTVRLFGERAIAEVCRGIRSSWR